MTKTTQHPRLSRLLSLAIVSLMTPPSAFSLQLKPQPPPMKGISWGPMLKLLPAGMTGAALATTVFFGELTTPPALAFDSSKTIQVQVEAPTLFKRLKEEKYQTELIDALKELQDVVGPDVIKVTPPSNFKGAARDLLSGKGEITLNGQPVDVAILSSEKGEITIQISNPLLPKVPILSEGKTIPFLSSEGREDTMIATSSMQQPDIWEVLDTVWSVFGPEEDVTVKTLWDTVGKAYGWDMTTPFYNQKFLGGFSITIPRAEDRGGPYKFVPANKDAAAGVVLGVGAIYGFSYSYYLTVKDYEERIASEKKNAAAEKKKAVAEKKRLAAVAKAAKKKADAKKEEAGEGKDGEVEDKEEMGKRKRFRQLFRRGQR